MTEAHTASLSPFLESVYEGGVGRLEVGPKVPPVNATTCTVGDVGESPLFLRPLVPSSPSPGPELRKRFLCLGQQGQEVLRLTTVSEA